MRLRDKLISVVGRALNVNCSEKLQVAKELHVAKELQVINDYE